MRLHATAAATASISVGTAVLGFAQPSPNVEVLERYMHFARLEGQLSDIKFEAFIRIPGPRKPEWLGSTLKAIRSSVSAIAGGKNLDDGRWLSQNVANSASDFFENTADLFPHKPFIYSSIEGDLVAEFKTDHGTLTSIVSPLFVLLFAVVNGVPSERRVSGTRGLREEVRRFIEPLTAGTHGDLATQK